ncbi:SRPBCC family protein [Haloarchaeobius sp. HME9146]|uniref:SRPBCC family protein n=1 Tax=Haloarchaeobius sp. HME9146 TaxID=2978732 RepID=UPI0021BE2E8B|nr:SRPBCC family protein [Haloarchaeobius sp. HME9146]MCT9098479.1 SRPBCC family protein [Haloarchaeobius sp. HME9146]
MDAIEISTVVYVPKEEAFEFLFDFTNHEQYSRYVSDVTKHGEGVGCQFDITLQWWKLEYTLSPRVTGIDRPERIDWDVPRDVRAEGFWALEDVPPESEQAQADGGPATRVRLRIEFDRAASRLAGLRLPPFVSLDWVIDRIKPIAIREAETVFERAIADLEGQRRDVHIELHTRPTTV